MYFKKLEIFGFKSFLNKTKLPFEPGVTAIVGPNGCGKSNIVDAIKWVIGEQSTKSMRASSMQDVIFNGTEKYDPLNVAEVSLVLSNEDRSLPVDYDEVTITRRLHRSGESEYLLNKTPVRLLDVRNLLLGTGIGTSSYSVVEQGRMDMILSSKPEDRRYIFEEASGITKFKFKKREALLKLDRTKDNLVRINDIVREIERQINSIERKARKAERYKAKFDELKDLDITLSYKKYNELSTDDTALGSQNSELRDRAEMLKSEVDEASELLTVARDEHNAAFNELQQLQSDLVRFTTDIDKNKHIVLVNNERIVELEKAVERMDWEIEEITERKDKVNNRLAAYEIRFLEVRSKREAKEEELGEIQQITEDINTQIGTYQQQLDMNKTKTIDMVSEQTKLSNHSIKLEADIQNAISRKKRLELEKNSVHSEKDNASVEYEKILQRTNTINTELEGKRTEFEVFNREYISKQEKLNQLDLERRGNEKKINEVKPRRLFLEKLVNEREGINTSVKGIMKQVENGNQDFSNVHGILSELINVEDKFEESIESLLGELAQAVVVEDNQTKDNVLAFLQENSMESVNIIVLQQVTAFLSKAQVGVEASGLEVLANILSSDEKYKFVFMALLKNAHVARSSEAAKKYFDVNQNSDAVIIGERGEVFRSILQRTKNYSGKETIPVFGRQEKVKQLMEEENAIAGEIEIQTAKIQELELWINESSRKRESLESELRQKQMEFADVSSRKILFEEKFNSLKEELVLLENEITEELTSIQDQEQEKKTLEGNIRNISEENTRLQVDMEQVQRTIQEEARRREETMMSLSDIKAELSGYIKDEENLIENIQRDKDSCARIDLDIEEKKVRIIENGGRIKSFREEKELLEQKNIEFTSLAEVRSHELDIKKENKDRLFEEIQKQEEIFRTKEDQLEIVRNKARDLDIMKKEVEYKRESIIEKMKDSYKVNISEMSLELEPETNWEQVILTIDELKKQLEKMGDVSLDAVEEHKQLIERFEFLSKQRDDLAEAREALMGAITKINRTTKKMFMETFEKIRGEFNIYFKMLFNGGKGDIMLEDENNILECGIDIIVRPPGKKLHNIMQLSGGEKAMTAIALIFAIFKVNPSPFCILDEIDAPLDESNIVRFCTVLKDFLKLSQFIIITHNRMTIQLADVLYGITMGEKGVSKVVSVKFSEDEDFIEESTSVPVEA